MQIRYVKDAEQKKNPHGADVRKMYASDHGQAMHITLEPKQSLKKHITPVDVFFYILEGKARVEIGDEAEIVEKDSIIESPAKIPHLVGNAGDGILRFLVVKMQKQEESTQLL
ncbi:cupin domain-containing protein [Methanohalophilus profundi]|uniref:cupin domain-containing protein n=1 Tax=Methanohalophilus profundi TaxID=2138083 RepID=UPI00101DA4A6|nr:cupin domain-containing protein [Methanohalophilus profundi]